ncbi:MAG TPA: hypothetical protein VFA04_02435 [Bryobacteraceae bacterium]|nr:hypothetical protein [Bryobacteraceae bacterium]
MTIKKRKSIRATIGTEVYVSFDTRKVYKGTVGGFSTVTGTMQYLVAIEGKDVPQYCKEAGGPYHWLFANEIGLTAAEARINHVG